MTEPKPNLPGLVRRAGPLALGVALSACAPTPQTTPINCATSEGDIRALRAEQEFARTHQLQNAFALVPAGALLGIATGTQQKKLEMLSPEYQQRIDARVAEIERTCGPG